VNSFWIVYRIFAVPVLAVRARFFVSWIWLAAGAGQSTFGIMRLIKYQPDGQVKDLTLLTNLAENGAR
jgi:hypothetical protein